MELTTQNEETKNKTGPVWTKEQEQAIRTRDASLLVSAAAGSGKTAVLTERILRMITSSDRPVDIDKILIVTYTEAAAMEMKERIQAAIEKKLMENDKDENLIRQAALLHSATITTIHSFCLSVIRDNFHRTDIEPGFRVADEGELRLIRQDVMDGLLEKYYSRKEEEFLRFVDCYASGRKDDIIEKLILKLYEYSRGYPRPEAWLDMCLSYYEEESLPLLFEKMEQAVRHELEELAELAKQNMEICLHSDGPYMYEEAAQEDVKILTAAAGLTTYDEMAAGLSVIKWKTLSRRSDDSVNMDKKMLFKSVRDIYKKEIKNIQSRCFYDSREQIAKDMTACAPVVRMLVSLVKEFEKDLSAEKRKRGVIDFHDMEQTALQILTEEKDGRLVPGAVAAEYARRFEEVMIDEYQDSNLLQETILTSVSKEPFGGHNLFTVGDVKQSIYSFRLSRPELFMSRYHRYGSSGDEVRIDLHKNFRSRRQVLDTVNELFAAVMRSEVGGVAYDEAAALHPGADFPEDSTGMYDSELLLLDTEEVKDLHMDPREAQAHLAANRILELKKTMFLWDQKAGQMRPMEYGDVVILARSLKNWSGVIKKVFKEYNIPVEAVTGEGYFSAYEVTVLLDFLRVLDNSRQDIPLAGVMKSFFGGFSEEELARICLYERGKEGEEGAAFYEQVLAFAKEEEVPEPVRELRDKTARLVSRMDSLRRKSAYMPVHKLLWEIISSWGFDLYVRSMPGGEQRYANVMMLLEKASEFEQTSYRGLFHFIRYIEKLNRYEIDFGEAGTREQGSQKTGVRVMSIHKSKGLEFPVVILAGMSDRFNDQSQRDNILLHSQLGIGMTYIDAEDRTKVPTVLRSLIARETKIDQRGEEQRVLYVAMTRPKQKLIMTGCRHVETDEMSGVLTRKVTVTDIAGASSYMDWIWLAARLMSLNHLNIKMESLEQLLMSVQVREAADDRAEEVLKTRERSAHPLPGLYNRLQMEQTSVYSHTSLAGKKRKYSVSELKKRQHQQDDEFPAQQLYTSDGTEQGEDDVSAKIYIPAFAGEKEKVSAAGRGTAYHKVLELWPYARTRQAVKEEKKMADQGTLSCFIQTVVEEFEAAGYLSREEAQTIRTEEISSFLMSNVGERMANADERGQLYREQPFVIGMDLTLHDRPENARESVLVQGIIDAYFREGDSLVVVDYKTDHVKNEAVLTERYKGQLDYYSMALTRLTGLPVKEKIIYALSLCTEITV